MIHTHDTMTWPDCPVSDHTVLPEARAGAPFKEEALGKTTDGSGTHTVHSQVVIH